MHLSHKILYLYRSVYCSFELRRDLFLLQKIIVGKLRSVKGRQKNYVCVWLSFLFKIQMSGSDCRKRKLRWLKEIKRRFCESHDAICTYIHTLRHFIRAQLLLLCFRKLKHTRLFCNLITLRNNEWLIPMWHYYIAWIMWIWIIWQEWVDRARDRHYIYFL